MRALAHGKPRFGGRAIDVKPTSEPTTTPAGSVAGLWQYEASWMDDRIWRWWMGKVKAEVDEEGSDAERGLAGLRCQNHGSCGNGEAQWV